MELKQLQDMQMTSCYSTDVISVCTKEKFVLIFLEMSSVAGQAQKLCSTIRRVCTLASNSCSCLSFYGFESSWEDVGGMGPKAAGSRGYLKY